VRDQRVQTYAQVVLQFGVIRHRLELKQVYLVNDLNELRSKDVVLADMWATHRLKHTFESLLLLILESFLKIFMFMANSHLFFKRITSYVHKMLVSVLHMGFLFNANDW
jgi:hypothetical protein